MAARALDASISVNAIVTAVSDKNRGYLHARQLWSSQNNPMSSLVDYSDITQPEKLFTL
jgi:hypothetical protein